MRKLGLTVTTITFVACLIFVEVFLALFAPVPDPYAKYKNYDKGVLNQYIRSEFLSNNRFMTEIESGLPGMEGQNIFSTNNMGFRGDYLAIPKPANEFRIFMVGGSTIECLYIDDSRAINTVLQQYLQDHANPGISIKVYNAGKSGDASDDHISMLAHRIMHLEPEVIIVFSGLNDLTRSIYNYDYLHFVKTSKDVNPSIPLFRFLATEFQISRRLYYAFKYISPADQDILKRIPLKTDYKSKVELRKSIPVSDQRPRVDANSYKTNLKTIAGIAKAHKTQLIFVTQQTTWNSSIDPEAKNWHWMLYRNGKTYREEFMDEALESLNEVMRQVALEHSIPIYDLAKTLPKSLEFFYDDVHFNFKGASVVGNELGKYIRLEFLASRSRPGRTPQASEPTVLEGIS